MPRLLWHSTTARKCKFIVLEHAGANLYDYRTSSHHWQPTTHQHLTKPFTSLIGRGRDRDPDAELASPSSPAMQSPMSIGSMGKEEGGGLGAVALHEKAMAAKGMAKLKCVPLKTAYAIALCILQVSLKRSQSQPLSLQPL